MKKFALLLIVYISFSATEKLRAAGIRFEENKSWTELLALAKKEHKLIFLDGYASWCGPCKYLQQNVFTQAAVGAYFNATFINAAMDMEAGEGPGIAEKFKVTAYPTLFFIDGDGVLMHKSVGALEANALIALGHDAVNPQKQYYRLKRLAKAGKLSPADFLAWVTAAEDLKDEDEPAIVKTYLALPGYDLLQKSMLDIALYHADVLTGGQIKELQQRSSTVMQLETLKLRDFNYLLIQKAIALALEKSFKDSILNIDLFKQTLAVYFPDRAALETEKMKVKYYAFRQEDGKCLDALTACFDTKRFRLSPEEVEFLVEHSIKIIVANDRGDEFAAKVKQYPLSPEDAWLSYYPDVALLMLYHEMRNTQETAALVQKIINNPNASERLKTAVKAFGNNDGGN